MVNCNGKPRQSTATVNRDKAGTTVSQSKTVDRDSLLDFRGWLSGTVNEAGQGNSSFHWNDQWGWSWSTNMRVVYNCLTGTVKCEGYNTGHATGSESLLAQHPDIGR